MISLAPMDAMIAAFGNGVHGTLIPGCVLEDFYEFAGRYRAVESGEDPAVRLGERDQVKISELLMPNDQWRMSEHLSAANAIGPEDMLLQFCDPSQESECGEWRSRFFRKSWIAGKANEAELGQRTGGES